MLLLLLADEIEQRCDFCGARRRLPLGALQVGIESGDPPAPTNPHAIALPACTDCGAGEFLQRVDSGQPGAAPGGVDDAAEHRRAVNALHAALLAAGNVGAGFREWFATESLATERAEIPWTFPGEPVPIAGRADVAESEFAIFIAARRGGG